MTNHKATFSTTELCERIREQIQERLDAPLQDASSPSIDDHLQTCVACRDFQRELESIRDSLRDIPQLSLPEGDLEAVWAQTVNAPVRKTTEPRTSPRAFSWLALAAAVLFAVVSLQLVPEAVAPTPPPTTAQVAPDAAEVELAAQQLRWALGRTGEALRKTRRAATSDLAGVDQTLNQLPIRIPLMRDGLTGKRGEL